MTSIKHDPYDTLWDKNKQLSHKVVSHSTQSQNNPVLKCPREFQAQPEDLRPTVGELDAGDGKYAQLFDLAPIAYFSYDHKGAITEVNVKGAELLGHERRSLIGQPMIHFVAQNTRNDFLSHLSGAFRDTPSAAEVTLVNNQGRSFPTVIQSSPIKDDRGHVVCCLTAAIDMTEQRKSEEMLRTAHNHLMKRIEDCTADLCSTHEFLKRETSRRRAAEAQLSAEKEILNITLNGIHDAVITTDVESNIILMNAVAEELTGRKLSECEGQPVSEILHIMDEKTHEIRQSEVPTVLATGQASEIVNHTLLKAKNGDERVIDHRATPISGDPDKVIGAVMVIRDVTDQKKLEEERLRANKLESVGFLAAGIAHDFNNLLTGILGNLSLAKKNVDNPVRLGRSLSNAEKATERAKNLTSQLLTFSKADAPIKKAISISDLIRECADLAISGSRAQCRFSLPQDLNLVEADEGQLTQVINNLIINAIQAMPGGGEIYIHGENVDIQKTDGINLPNGSYIKITIRDQGLGIDPANLDKIFDPYFTTKNCGRQKGCGLGLATSYSIIKKHNGLITVDSNGGRGTAFHIYLPAANEEVRIGEIAQKPCGTLGGHILVMDDEEILRESSASTCAR